MGCELCNGLGIYRKHSHYCDWKNMPEKYMDADEQHDCNFYPDEIPCPNGCCVEVVLEARKCMHCRYENRHHARAGFACPAVVDGRFVGFNETKHFELKKCEVRDGTGLEKTEGKP